MEKKELIQELIYSLPSKRLIEVVNVGAVRVGNEYVILKQRPGYEFKLEESIHFVENLGWQHDYKEILGKSVIFSGNAIGNRGVEAINKFLESEKAKEPTEFWLAFVKATDKILNVKWSERKSSHHHAKAGFDSKEDAEAYIKDVEFEYNKLNESRSESDHYKLISGMIPYKPEDNETVENFFKTY